MILTIDIGNSRTKWALYAEAWQAIPEPLSFGVLSNSSLQSNLLHFESLNALLVETCTEKDITRVLLCSVAPTEQSERFVAFLRQRLSCSITIFKTAKTCAGLINGYQQAELLGQDRWASMIGAWHRCQSDCMVVSAGSALTVDVIEAETSAALPNSNNSATPNALIGWHRGGVIVPGLQLMQGALFTNTGQLASRYQASQPVEPTSTLGLTTAYLGQTTAQAIDYGVLMAWSGVVKQIAEQHLAMTGRKLRCLITGGDAELLAKHLQQFNGFDNNVVTLAHLIFEGMLVAEREQSCVG